MKHGLILITLLMLMAACSSEDVSQSKVDTTVELSPQTITLEPTQMITENEMIESNQDIKLINSENNDNVETQRSISPQTVEEEENEIQTLSQEPTEPLVDEKEETLAEDFIMFGDSKYINLMHEEKFQDWINVAVKYGATLYAIPYSDVFAIVKDEEVLVGMSTGVASAAPNHIDILCDLMADKGESAEKIIEGVKQVAQTGESVELVGPQEFDDDFSIEEHDEWIVVSW
ncbi:hypothetical protein MLOOGBEN_14125 [Bacillus sp. EB106-08-02-XG196]|uniref:hypothetical protein n=1 Tax=Bacillus sp. EB106-08-02-XG196 TaxID=2737049 RepID=UPI0015C48290|nr:hypothetical protein [Bacillus sp. EB106-08-02-XG196]NWQ41833.1 hypothetical protein [Bacillus sp. EB106-08-02-XG196]